MLRTVVRSAIILALLSSTERAHAQQPDGLKEGLRLAEQVCSGCHAVRRGQSRSPNSKSPTFYELATAPSVVAAALMDALSTPHQGMPTFAFSVDQKQALVGYILNLRTITVPKEHRSIKSIGGTWNDGASVQPIVIHGTFPFQVFPLQMQQNIAVDIDVGFEISEDVQCHIINGPSQIIDSRIGLDYDSVTWSAANKGASGQDASVVEITVTIPAMFPEKEGLESAPLAGLAHFFCWTDRRVQPPK